MQKKQHVLICDEITSGWRITNGGSYKISGIKPDIVVYGKGMGGGYAISAIVGKKYNGLCTKYIYFIFDVDRTNWFCGCNKYN